MHHCPRCDNTLSRETVREEGSIFSGPTTELTCNFCGWTGYDETPPARPIPLPVAKIPARPNAAPKPSAPPVSRPLPRKPGPKPRDPVKSDGLGIVCPQCGSGTCVPYNARKDGYVYRRRKCIGCGENVSTYEYPTGRMPSPADMESLRKRLDEIDEIVGKMKRCWSAVA